MEYGNGPPGSDPDTVAHGGTGAPGAHGDVVGQVIGGRYRLIRLLGEGAMGAVYLGEHLKIGRKDAIKILRGGLANDKESIARFNRGARNMSAIRHTNVCTLYDYGETDDGSPFLALELITGESLKELVTREPLDLRRAFAIAKQTAYALDAAHDAGIVHRDLKPANIMLEPGRDGSDIVKVVDFDIAKGPEAEGGDEVTRLGYVVGTPEYMSPEQLTGERLDGRSDIYSLGIVMFRMFTGLLPFQGGNTQEIMIQRLTGEPLTLAAARPDLSFPPGLQPILDRALARDRGQRYTRAGDIARALAAIPLASPQPGVAGGEAIPETRVAPSPVAAATGPTLSATPERGRSRLLMIGGAATVVVAVAVAAVLMRDAPAAESSDTTRQPIELGSSANTDPPPPVVVDSPEAQPRGGGEGATQRGGGGTVPAESVSPEPPRPQPEPPPRLPTGARIVAASALDVLLAQLDLLGLDTNELGATRNLVAARAARDTAEAFWELAGVTDRERALAASIVGTAQFALGDGAACALWFNRALAIQPDNEGWRGMLDNNCPRVRE